MARNDRFLAGIAIGAVAIVVVAFIVVLTRPEPAHVPDDGPEAAVHNYLLALHDGDYERAYGYLSHSLENRPEDVDEFAEMVTGNRRLFGDDRETSLSVDSSDVKGDFATVFVLESSFRQGDVFNSSVSSMRFEMQLRPDDSGAWKLVEGERFWSRCWNDAESFQCR